MGKINEIAEGWANIILRQKEVEKIAASRMNICNTCEHNSKLHKTVRPDVHCVHCGCTLAAKTRSMQSECPIGKWKAIIPNENGKQT